MCPPKVQAKSILLVILCLQTHAHKHTPILEPTFTHVFLHTCAMYVCIYRYMYARSLNYLHARTCIYICISIYIYVFQHLQSNGRSRSHHGIIIAGIIHTHTHTHTLSLTHAYIQLHTDTRTLTHTHIFIHTLTHTHEPTQIAYIHKYMAYADTHEIVSRFLRCTRSYRVHAFMQGTSIYTFMQRIINFDCSVCNHTTIRNGLATSQSCRLLGRVNKSSLLQETQKQRYNNSNICICTQTH